MWNLFSYNLEFKSKTVIYKVPGMDLFIYRSYKPTTPLNRNLEHRNLYLNTTQLDVLPNLVLIRTLFFFKESQFQHSEMADDMQSRIGWWVEKPVLRVH